MQSLDRITALTRILALLSVILGLSTYAKASVDPTFNAVPSTPITGSTAIQQIVQPDGKIIVYGPKMVLDGVAKGDMFRLNADGTNDATFSYCGCGLGFIRNVMLAPDGKIIVAGGENRNAKAIRLNPDGSIDGSFLAFVAGPPPFFGGAEFTVNAVQPDGKVMATLRYSSTGHVSFTLYRFNADGSVDSGFPSIPVASGSPVFASVYIQLLPDGRFYMAVTAGNVGSGATLRRRMPDGSIDPTWEAPTFAPNGFGVFTSINDLDVAADGAVLVAGAWDTVNGISRRNLIRLQSAGNVDLGFTSPDVQLGHGVEILPDGKILFSGRVDISGISRIARYNADGSPDNTYVMDPSVVSILNSWSLDDLGRVVFLGSTTTGVRLVRLLANGSLDTSFAPNITLFGTVNLLAVQTDGKVLIAGAYTQMNGVERNSFSRVNADGSLDSSFDPGSGFNNPPSQFAIQTDGKILAAGEFTNYNGTPVPGIVRINTNGSIDNTFSVNPSGPVLSVALQPDGKIIIGGSFATINGTNRTGVARLESNGALDTTFDVVIGNPTILHILVEPGGKIMVGGGFSGVNGFNRNNLVRLESTGGLDQTFTASVGTVTGLIRQPDGKYILLPGSQAATVIRRNADGSADTSFVAPTFVTSSSSDLHLQTILLMQDGSILVGGRFDTVAGSATPNIARLAPNGSFDPLFMPLGANNRVRSIVAYSADKVIAGGNFTTIGGVPKPGVARLNVAAFHGISRFDFDGDGKADVAVYRPSTGVWYQLLSNGNSVDTPTFGLAGDIPVPADYDGDGKTDLAIFRPSSGDWWYRASSNGALRSTHWGGPGDIPLPADINDDGKDDFVVYRPSNNFWYRITTTGSADQRMFGLAGDKPVIGDFDGDGRADQAIFRPSTGDWWYSASSAGGAFRATHWGQNGDIPAPADFDGDGKTDMAVFRPSNGAWYILKSSDLSYIILSFGLDGDRPIPADYDGDGKADIAVFRPSTGVWYLLRSTAGLTGFQWGVASDVAIPNAFISQ